MSSSSVVELALKAAQDILWTNLARSDEAAVQAIRNIVRTPGVKRAVEHGNDTALTFVLRATNQIVSGTRPARDTVNMLWAILDQSELNRLLGLPQNSRMKVGRGSRRPVGRGSAVDYVLVVLCIG